MTDPDGKVLEFKCGDEHCMIWNAKLLPEYSYGGTNRSKFVGTEALLKKVASILNRLAYEIMPPYDFDPNLTKYFRYAQRLRTGYWVLN